MPGSIIIIPKIQLGHDGAREILMLVSWRTAQCDNELIVPGMAHLCISFRVVIHGSEYL